MPQLVIDDCLADFAEGQTILQVAAPAGISIPTLCHHPDLTDVGSCRICMEEIEGSEQLVPACKHPASAGLRIRTHPPATTTARRMVLQLLTSQGGFHTGTADRTLTEFDRLWREYDVVPTQESPPRYPVDSDPSPFLHVDLNQCILCTRIVFPDGKMNFFSGGEVAGTEGLPPLRYGTHITGQIADFEGETKSVALKIELSHLINSGDDERIVVQGDIIALRAKLKLGEKTRIPCRRNLMCELRLERQED